MTYAGAARGLVERTCAAQGLPASVGDEETLAFVARLIVPRRDEARASTRANVNTTAATAKQRGRRGQRT